MRNLDLSENNVIALPTVNDSGVDGWQPSLKKLSSLNSIRIVKLEDLYSNLGYISKKSKKFFDLNYSMENNLEKFFIFLNRSNFKGTNYKVFSRLFIIKVLYKLYKKIPINQRMFLRAIISSTLLKFR